MNYFQFHYSIVLFVVHIFINASFAQSEFPDQRNLSPSNHHIEHKLELIRHLPQFVTNDLAKTADNFRYSRNNILSKHSISDSIQLAWRHEYASMLDSNEDGAFAIAADEQGFIYVTGKTTKIPNGTDFLTIKYDSNGNQIWSATYNGTGSHDDFAQYIALDSFGNVYVGGTSVGINTNYDITIVKYNSAGHQQWAARYNGSENKEDLITAMSIDKIGNIYLAGESFENGRESDVVAIKYNTDGIQEWIYYYDGFSRSMWYYTKQNLVIDENGNSYLMAGSRSNKEIFTIKINSSGEEIWMAKFESFFNANAQSITIDLSGNIYVLGSTSTNDHLWDFVTIKYDTSGIEQWISRYGGALVDLPYDFAVDAIGNVYITGIESNPILRSGYVTIKYDAKGTLKWVHIFDDLIDGHIFPASIKLDNQGNIYNTGTWSINFDQENFITIKLDTSGQHQWIATHDSPEFHQAYCLDTESNYYIAGYGGNNSGTDFITTKINSTGAVQWVKRYSGSKSTSDEGKKIVLDDHGNTYVAATSSSHLRVIKYDCLGIIQWQFLNESVIDNEREVAIIVDDDDVYIAATSNVFIILIKLNSLGEKLWDAKFPNAENYWFAKFNAMQVDHSGNIIVTGESTKSYNEKSRITIIKFSSTGNQEWIKTYINTKNNYECPKHIAIDDLGNIYIIGITGTDLSPYWGFYSSIAIKLNSSGELQWAKSFDNPEFGIYFPTGAVVDRIGNIIVNLQYRHGITTFKYDPNGNEIWKADYPSIYNNLYLLENSLKTDNFNNIFIFQENGGIIKYQPDGNVEWSFESEGDILQNAKRGGFAIDNVLNAYVFVNNSKLSQPYYLLKYDQTGLMQWASLCEFDYTDMEVDSKGNIYLTGTNMGKSWSTCVTAKFGTKYPIEYAVPKDYKLNQNYPNPFYYGTCIDYELPIAGHVTLKVYNLLGQEVDIIVDSFQEEGIHRESWYKGNLPSGIYFYRILVNGFSAWRKSLLIN